MLRMAISAGQGRAGLAAWAGRVRVDWVLVREKQLAGAELVASCREVRAAAQTGVQVLVAGGRVDVALAAGLQGVHLGGGTGQLSVRELRRIWPGARVSVSCHTVDDVARAQEAGASLALFAPVFGKRVDGQEVLPGVGLGALEQACRVAGGMPIFALGGVTERNAAECLLAGAAGVAGIRMFG